MTQLHPDICVTMLATEAFFERIQKEAARSFDEGQEECASRLRPVILLQPHIIGSHMVYVYRIVSLGAFGMFKTAKDDARFEEMWKTLLAGEGPVCAHTGIQYPGLPRPRALIVDVCARVSSEYAQNHPMCLLLDICSTRSRASQGLERRHC